MEVSSTDSVKTAALAGDGVSTSIEVHDASAHARKCAFFPSALVYEKEGGNRIIATTLLKYFLLGKWDHAVLNVSHFSFIQILGSYRDIMHLHS